MSRTRAEITVRDLLEKLRGVDPDLMVMRINDEFDCAVEIKEVSPMYLNTESDDEFGCNYSNAKSPKNSIPILLIK